MTNDRNGYPLGAALKEYGVQLGIVEVRASGTKFLCGVFPHEDGRNVGFRIPIGPAREAAAVNVAATMRALADELDPPAGCRCSYDHASALGTTVGRRTCPVHKTL